MFVIIYALFHQGRCQSLVNQQACLLKLELTNNMTESLSLSLSVQEQAMTQFQFLVHVGNLAHRQFC